MREEVFSPLLNKEELDPNYKTSVIIEYIRSLRLHKLRISYYYYEIVIQVRHSRHVTPLTSHTTHVTSHHSRDVTRHHTHVTSHSHHTTHVTTLT